MVTQLAQAAGLSPDSLYFNIEKVGNTSSASILLAIHDAVRDGVVSEPVRIFAPGFGAGAVAGFAVLRLDPAVVAVHQPGPPSPTGPTDSYPPTHRAHASDDIHLAFG
jgi:hypothetical protein